VKHAPGLLKAGYVEVECYGTAPVDFTHLPDVTAMSAARIEYVFIAVDLQEIKVYGQHIFRLFRDIGYLLLLGSLARVQLLPFFQKLILRLFVGRIGHAAVNRAYLCALGFFEPADTFGTFGGLDIIDSFSLFNSLVLALSFTCTAADTIVSYLVSHSYGTSNSVLIIEDKNSAHMLPDFRLVGYP